MSARVSKHVDMERDGLAIKAEYLQTDPWAIDAILRSEILTPIVIDPCCGDGRMAVAALRAGAKRVYASDKFDWGFRSGSGSVHVYQPLDFVLDAGTRVHRAIDGATVFMNPPFSLSCQFVDAARRNGARKIVCFQRSVWRESEDRREWWDAKPPSRVYQCGNRAICWYGTIPPENRRGGAYQPHSWFVWERDQPPGTLQGTIWKND